MRRSYVWGIGIMFAHALAACSGDDNAAPGGGGSGGTGSPDGGTGGAGAPGDGGLALRTFTAPNMGALGPGQMLLTASGEHLAETGYDFPPATAGDPAFVDGWEIRFDHLLVTFDKVTLSLGPDTNPGDQSQTGAVIAEADGPWAIDLHKANPGDVAGKEPDEKAIPFATITRQNDGSALLTDGTRYAVGFQSVVASPTAINVNLDGDALPLYQGMAQSGCTVLYTGTATFNGQNCQTPAQAEELASIPTTVHFSLCFKSPTRFVNCQNQDNMGMGIGSEGFQRGVAFPANTFVTGEVTFHTDHPFWESTEHDTPAHFDQYAAQAVGQEGGVPTVTLEKLVGVDYVAFTDGAGRAVPWRSCVDATRYTPPSGAQLSFDPHGVSGLNDYYQFATYNQSTQGHWNGEEGLCAVLRQYPSPP
jgi:hypothetical protein